VRKILDNTYNGGSTWRASRRDAKGRHRGIKCPFFGRRWNVSRNINAKARQAHQAHHDAAVISARAAQRIAGERRSWQPDSAGGVVGFSARRAALADH
jgi:3-mercaptopyruvate sulfurtransferase SseA